MNLRLQLKYLIANFLQNTGLLKYALGNFATNNFLILMYHRVLDTVPIECQIQPGMYVLSKTFEKHIVYLKQHFTITDLSTLSSLPYSRIKNTKPFCALTFDDGWFDFYKNAFPVIKKHNVPATIFLPTAYIGTKKWFWTDQVAYLYQKNRLNVDSFEYDLGEFEYLKHLINLNKNAKNFDKIISQLKLEKEETINQIINNNLRKLDDLNLSLNEPAFLSWWQVCNMHQSGLVSFGSHTTNHKILTLLNHDQVHKELMESIDILLSKKLVEPHFIPFCYPNGNYDNNLISLVAKNGHHLAVTTKRGRNTPGTNMFELKRIGMHEDVSCSSSMLGCRLLGIF